jgi:hypothetical protein
VIRRYATEFRLLLAMTDALIAVAAFLFASIWRFGSDWASLWRLYLPARPPRSPMRSAG